MKRVPSLFCLTLIATWAATAAPTNTPARKLPPLPGDRFLFVVDTSSGMTKLAAASRQAVFDLIYTGINGHMRPGDSYGLWTFNNEVQVGKFPLQVWKTNALDLSSAAGRFLREQHYEKKPRLDLAVDKAKVVVSTVKDVTLFFVSDGRTPFEGTPFDGLLNKAVNDRASDVRQSKKPLVATLVARKGDFVGWSVTLAGERIPMPDHSPPPLVQAPTNPPVATTNTAAVVRATPAPIIIQKRPRPELPSTPASNATLQAASGSAPAPAPPETNTAVRPEPQPSSLASPASETAAAPPTPSLVRTAAPPVTLRPKNAALAAADASSDPVSPAPVSAPTAPMTAQTQPTQAVPVPLPVPKLLTTTTVQAREPASAPAGNGSTDGLLAVTPTPIAAAPAANPILMLSIGALLLISAMVLTVLFIHNLRSAPKASIISESIYRERGPRDLS
jgi:hypothetical protein